jgi:hypothetical protein
MSLIANSGLSRTLGVVGTSLVWCGAKPPACSWHTRVQRHDTTIARVWQVANPHDIPPGPSTGERPIYAGRFNMEKRKSLAEERVDL